MKPVHTALHSVLFFSGLLLPSFAHAVGADAFEGVKRVDLRVSAGQIRVSGVDGKVAQLEVKKKRYDERCRLVIEQRDDLLFVELASKNLYSARCEADFNLKVPKQAALKIKGGRVSLENCVGQVGVEL